MSELTTAKHRLNSFIATERAVCVSMFPEVIWDADSWAVLAMDKTFRGTPFNLVFIAHGSPLSDHALKQPAKHAVLPSPYREFCKALVVNIARSCGVKARALNAYLMEARRLYNVMHFRDETSPTALLNFHFDYLFRHLVSTNYVQLYDACTTLSKISQLVDESGISVSPTAFRPPVKAKRQHNTPAKHNHEPLSDKEFSREAVEAYAVATNNPVSDSEEIILRALDLLFAMGQRANEITHIPFDCWVERIEKNAHGEELRHPSTGDAIKSFGIRYYAEKQAQDRVHWLADQDVPFARRAIDRLKVLCEDARRVAAFQRRNRGRIWSIPRERELPYREIQSYLTFATNDGLQKCLSRLGASPCTRIGGAKYLAGDIEDVILRDKRLGGHIRDDVALSDESGKPILYKENLLIAVFDGQSRLQQRSANLIRVAVHKLSVVHMNEALGAISNRESVFDRRGLREADGSRITLTSHMPRHWRNTLYEIAGMSETQQALALGRADISQNPHYQHATVEEKNAALSAFHKSRSPKQRVELAKQAIREGLMQGNIAGAYAIIKQRSPVESESFLTTHILAAHVTPWGACLHDFSKTPCPKHLQCFDSCGHLHRTTNPEEFQRLDKLILRQQENIERMSVCGCGDAGSDAWIACEQRKLSGMQAARAITPAAVNVQVFPSGRKLDAARPRSAVRDSNTE